MMWGTTDNDPLVAELVELAKDDWTQIGFLLAAVNRRFGRDIGLEEKARALGELTAVLIDHDVVPGDLDKGPGFAPWPGSREERAARVEAGVLALGSSPMPGDVAWWYYEPQEPAVSS